MAKYDQKLITNAQEYFSKRYGRAITPDEAESFLKSLLNLYNSFYSNK
jgi:hypothetical protein